LGLTNHSFILCPTGDLHGAVQDAGAAVKRAPTAQDRASAQAALTNYMAQLEAAKVGGQTPETKPPAAVEIAMAQGEEMAAEGLKYMEKLRRKEAAYQMAVRVRNEGRRLRHAARHAGGPPPTEATTETVALGDGNELLLTRLPIVYVEKEEETEKVSATPAAPAALPQEAPADNDGGFKTSYDEGIRALRAKRWQDAEMAFSTAAAAAPPARLPWCHLKRGAARLGAGYPEGALEELEKAQDSAPKATEDAPLWLELWQTRAKALERLGRLDAAREELEEADAELHDLITPQKKNLLLGKITDLLEKKSKAADAATRRSPTARSAARASATTAAATKSPQQRPLIEEITSPNPVVEQAAAAAGGSSPDDLACKAEAARSHFDNAMQALKSKSFVEAKKGFQMASILDPSLMDAHKHLALMEVVMENWSKVEAHCTTALAAPGGEEDDEVRVMRASAYVNQGRRLEALTEYSILSAQFGNVEAGNKVEKLRKELVGSGELSEEEAARLVGVKQPQRGGGEGEGSAPPASSPAPFTALLDPNFDMKTFDELESIDFAKVGPQVR
jgi:tetratricopeptide (TPR) repeat protein